jgi:adenine-specific DNA-methyltransferase
MAIAAKEMTMDERKAKVGELVRQFSENRDFYLTKDFVESEARSKFIDPLLECLKWDVHNEKGARHDRQEVITEDRVVIEGQVKHPDYTLCYGGEKKLYVEAKQPSIDLKSDPEPALQVRRYAYTSKMPIAILTDFQELAIYDTRVKPGKKDTAATARIEYLTYDQYAEKFEDLYNKISWDAVDLGRFDSYYEGIKDKKGTATVDNDILAMIESWRTELAEDIALHNGEIDEYNLTSAVQKIIDRILFLRICEDKEIEDRFTLRNVITSKTGIYHELKALFAKANDKFNAGLFATDEWLNALSVQDKTLSDIVSALYYPECQYEFSVLPVEILGSIYERFLGRIIRFTRKTKNGHSVEIIEKPEVQKAGGVYYTPPYIVKYIVAQTIGKKLEGKTPDDVSRMRFVDPACGSGSFLVGAYQYILDWHLDYYYMKEHRADAEKKGIIYQDAGTHVYKLSIEEKKRILLNNIYGVDIDTQAVEVTKLSLFLKLLENEGKALSATGQSSLFRTSDLGGKILPSMNKNIKCGNSLIGTDYYEDKDMTLFGIEDQRKVNAFDWDEQFPDVFRNGGFDCVIGNPPYLRVQGLRENYEEEAKFYEKMYKSATERFDFYVLFMERGFSLLNKTGIQSFILPHKFINSNYGIGIRKFIYDNKALNFIVHFGSCLVFDEASVYTCIIGLSHDNKDFNYAQINPLKISEKINFEKLPVSNLENITQWRLASSDDSNVIEKLHKQPYTVKDIFKGIFQGIVSGDNKAFYLTECSENKEYIIGYSVVLGKRVEIEKEVCKPFLTGKTIDRYGFVDKKEYMIYPYHLVDGKTRFYTEKELKSCFPKCFEYFDSMKDRLFSRGTESMKYPVWYALWNSRNIDTLSSKKILTPDICYGTSMYYDESGYYYNDTAYGLILKEPDDVSYKAYLALLNSNVTWYYLQKTGTSLRGGYFRFKTKYLEPFPLPDLKDNDKNSLAKNATALLEIKKQFNSAKTEADKSLLKQRAEIIDNQINRLVYKLYGLSDEEIAVVEGK